MNRRGPYKKRRLQNGLQRLAESLLQEAQRVGRVTLEKLDELLDLGSGECERYAASPNAVRKRAPSAAAIQRLENGLAALLKRPRRQVVVIDSRTRKQIGIPCKGTDFRNYSPSDLSLAYAGGWPTYGEMIESGKLWADYLFATHIWQWGLLWEKGVPELSRAELGIPDDVPVDELICILQDARSRAEHDYEMHFDRNCWPHRSGEWADEAWRRLNFLAPRCATTHGSPRPAHPVAEGRRHSIDLSVLD